jgi:hypothetical protein
MTDYEDWLKEIVGELEDILCHLDMSHNEPFLAPEHISTERLSYFLSIAFNAVDDALSEISENKGEL